MCLSCSSLISLGLHTHGYNPHKPHILTRGLYIGKKTFILPACGLTGQLGILISDMGTYDPTSTGSLYALLSALSGLVTALE